MGGMVSCIMPTCNRRAFVPLAIRYFQRQDYADRELIVLDDGADVVEDLIPSDPQIRYVRLAKKHTLGAKRNLACQDARGEIIVHWDDDDWAASWRVSYQVAALLKTRVDICGLDRFFVYEPAANRAWRYVYRGTKPWAHGATLCYTRSFWKRNPFPDINLGEDVRFVWSDRPKKVLALRDPAFYVALVHSENTSPKRPQRKTWHLCPVEEVRELMREDWSFHSAFGQSDFS